MKPILFNTPMTKAILDGRKTQTRRVIKDADPNWPLEWLGDDAAVMKIDRYGMEYAKPVPGLWATFEAADHAVEYPMFKAPCEPGDILYVRETWRLNNPSGDFKYNNRIAELTYRADLHTKSMSITPDMEKYLSNKWRPSIHMPKEAARLFLRVTDVRAERLQEITAEGAQAEGIRGYNVGMGEVAYSAAQSYEEAGNVFHDDPVGAFAALWVNTVKIADLPRYGWAANPWVWVICFERCEKPETET